jgi:hypothetical protein
MEYHEPQVLLDPELLIINPNYFFWIKSTDYRFALKLANKNII